MKASVLLDEAISLPVEERAFGGLFAANIERRMQKHEAAWAAVARRRLDELRSEKVVPISGEVVFAHSAALRKMTFDFHPRFALI